MKKKRTKLAIMLFASSMLLVISSTRLNNNTPIVSHPKYAVRSNTSEQFDSVSDIKFSSEEISKELQTQKNYYQKLYDSEKDDSEKAKIQSLIDANNDLTDQNNISLSSRAKAKSYSSEVNLVNAFFTSNGYVLSSELLLHAYSNGELDSMYTPVHKDLITKSSVFQSIKTGTSLEGSNEFPNSGTVVDKDLYYAIHAFRFLKSPSGRVVNIEDRYDYAKSSNYPSISGVAVNWMYNAQEAGTLTPFFTSIAFSYDDMEVKNTTQDVQIGDVRMFEKAMGIGKKETRTFNVTFKRDGWKVLQTFGLVDTVLYLYDENGSLIKRDDDSGSGTNSYILLNASKNKKYKLVLKYLNDTKFGATRLVITNSFYDKDLMPNQWIHIKTFIA